MACRRAATSSPSAPSIRTISPTTSAFASRVTLVRAVGAVVSLTGEMGAGQRGDLRQVGDADDLPVLARARSCSPTAAAVLPPIPASTSSKTSVDRRRRGRCAHDREHHPRELAARRRLAQRAGGDAGVRGDEELHLVAARRAVALALAQRRLEGGALHGQLGEPLAHRHREPAPPRAALLAQHPAAFASSPRARRGRPRAASMASSAPRARAPAPALLPVGEDGLDRPAVLALEPVEEGEALLDLVQAGARGAVLADRLPVAPQLPRHVVGLDRQRGEPRGQLVELGVHAGHRLERGRRPDRASIAPPCPRPATGPRRPRRRRRGAGETPSALALGGQARPPPRDRRRRRRSRRARSESRSSSRSRAPARVAQFFGSRPQGAHSRHQRRRKAARRLGVPAARKSRRGSRAARRRHALAVLVLAVEGEQARAAGRAGRPPWPSGRDEGRVGRTLRDHAAGEDDLLVPAAAGRRSR